MENFSVVCGFCKKGYNKVRPPRNLSCGHSVCTTCVNDRLTKHGFCPECLEKHYVISPNDTPVNYPLARFIHSNPSGQITIPHRVPLPFVDEVVDEDLVEGIGTCPSHGGVTASVCISCSMWVCVDCLVTNHRTSPRGNCKILGIRDAIKQIKLEHQKESNALLGKVKLLKRKLEEEESEFRRFCFLEKSFYHRRLTVKINRKFKDLINKEELITKDFVDRLDQVSGDRAKAITAVELTTSCEKLIKCQEDFEKYMNEEDERKEPFRDDLFRHLKADLQHLIRESKKPIYVSYQKEGKSRWAPAVPRNKGLLVYSLRDGTPPKDGIVLPFTPVRELVYQEEPMVFLEVAVAGLTKGIAYIQLFSESNLCNQTVELFLGENGHCYRNTKFFYVCEYDVLRGGDFVNNDGTGTLCRDLKNFGENDYNRWTFRMVPGLFEVHKYFMCPLYFNLECTTHPIDCPVGVVVQGLDILKAISRVKPIEESSISECGLFIPLRKCAV